MAQADEPLPCETLPQADLLADNSVELLVESSPGGGGARIFSFSLLGRARGSVARPGVSLNDIVLPRPPPPSPGRNFLMPYLLVLSTPPLPITLSLKNLWSYRLYFVNSPF